MKLEWNLKMLTVAAVVGVAGCASVARTDGVAAVTVKQEPYDSRCRDKIFRFSDYCAEEWQRTHPGRH